MQDRKRVRGAKAGWYELMASLARGHEGVERDVSHNVLCYVLLHGVADAADDSHGGA